MVLVRSSKSGGNTYKSKTDNALKAARVVDVILDINHPLAEEYGGNDAIGTIFYSLLENTNQNAQSGNNALNASPLFTHLKYYPLINEIVLILTSNDRDIYGIDSPQKSYYLTQINMWGHPHHNALPTSADKDLSASDYIETEAGITRQVIDEGTDIRLGIYFNEKLDIKPLLPYEGDTIIEGRFGNSIRFGSTNISDSITETNGWSDSGETGDPIIIIRNGQSPNTDGKGWIHTTEKINEDPSSIYLCSNQQLTSFVQASPFMASWDTVYVRPKSLEEELIQTEPEDLSNTPTALSNAEDSPPPPPGNDETDTSLPAGPPPPNASSGPLEEFDQYPEQQAVDAEGEGIGDLKPITPGTTLSEVPIEEVNPREGGVGSTTYNIDYEIPGVTRDNES